MRKIIILFLLPLLCCQLLGKDKEELERLNAFVRSFVLFKVVADYREEVGGMEQVVFDAAGFADFSYSISLRYSLLLDLSWEELKSVFEESETVLRRHTKNFQNKYKEGEDKDGSLQFFTGYCFHVFQNRNKFLSSRDAVLFRDAFEGNQNEKARKIIEAWFSEPNITFAEPTKEELLEGRAFLNYVDEIFGRIEVLVKESLVHWESKGFPSVIGK